MKTLAKITLLLIVILLFSCNKDDSSDDTKMNKSEHIVGDWQLHNRILKLKMEVSQK